MTRTGGSEPRVAIISDASSYVGPDLARLLADRGHDLVLGDAAHFAAPFVDGTSRFTTGQFVAYAGGWA